MDERRTRRLAMITAMAAIGPLSVLGVVVTAPTWWEGAVAATGFLLTLGLLREWSLEGYPRRSMLALAFTGVAWMVGALTLTSPVSFVPFSLVGALLLARTRASRRWLVVFALVVAAIGALAVLVHPASWRLTVLWVLAPCVGTVFIGGVILFSESIWLLVRRLERAGEVEAELAVAQERVRFASDLHDIQGHGLHVIRLKSALAQKVMHENPAQAETELQEIRRLADETIAQTRTLAYAQHTLSMAAELENARNLCVAAGITVDARVDDDGATTHPLLAQVLREATTNLLRHAQPARVTIRATPTTVEVTNDGVTVEGRPLRGLARLGERLEQDGGTLEVERLASSFTVRAHTGPRSGRPEHDVETG